MVFPVAGSHLDILLRRLLQKLVAGAIRHTAAQRQPQAARSADWNMVSATSGARFGFLDSRTNARTWCVKSISRLRRRRETVSTASFMSVSFPGKMLDIGKNIVTAFGTVLLVPRAGCGVRSRDGAMNLSRDSRKAWKFIRRLSCWRMKSAKTWHSGLGRAFTDSMKSVTAAMVRLSLPVLTPVSRSVPRWRQRMAGIPHRFQARRTIPEKERLGILRATLEVLRSINIFRVKSRLRQNTIGRHVAVRGNIKSKEGIA